MGKHEGPMKRNEKRTEFSKLIAIIAIIMWLAVNVFGMTMMVLTMDLSPMMYVIGSVDAVVAVVYATYAHKAKAENLIKLKKIYGDDATPVIQGMIRSESPIVDEVPGYEDTWIV